MAKVVLISMYDDWAIGSRTLANALSSEGHDPVIIHFKLPSAKKVEGFLETAKQYSNTHSTETRNEFVSKAYQADVNPWSENELHKLGELIEYLSPDIVGITTRCVYESQMKEIALQLRRADNAVLLAGGYGATLSPELYVEYFDFVCRGEGEDALLAMARYVDKGQLEKIYTIPNLGYMKDNRTIINPIAAPSDIIDFFFTKSTLDIPHFIIESDEIRAMDPFLGSIDFCRYPKYYNSHGKREYYTMAGRGCHGHCAFCSVGTFFDLYKGKHLRARRMRPIDNIIAELRAAKENGIDFICFMDSYFLAPRAYLNTFFCEYKKHIGLPFFAQFFPNQIMRHPDIIESACDAGLRRTVIGIQSGGQNPSSNNVFKRKTVHDDIIQFANLLTCHNDLLVDYHFITHNPFESDQVFEETISLIGCLPKKNTQLVLGRLTPFTGTEIAARLADSPSDRLTHEEHNKRHLLLLMRFFTSDEVFDKSRYETDKMSFDEMMAYYKGIPKREQILPDWMIHGHASLKIVNESNSVCAILFTENIQSSETQKSIQSVKYNAPDIPLILFDSTENDSKSRISLLNSAFEISKHRYFIVAAKPVRLSEGWFHQVQKTFREDIAVIVPTLKDTEGRVLYSGGLLAGDSQATCLIQTDTPPEPRDTQVHVGPVLIIDKSKVGHLRFDETLKEGALWDFCLKVWESEYRVVAAPKIVVTVAPETLLTETTHSLIKSIWIDTGRMRKLEDGIWMKSPSIKEHAQLITTIRRIFSQISNIADNEISAIVLSTLIAYGKWETVRPLLLEELEKGIISSQNVSRAKVLHSALVLWQTQPDRIINQPTDQVMSCEKKVQAFLHHTPLNEAFD